MNAVRLGDFHKLRHLHVRNIVGSAVALGPLGGTQRAEADDLDAALHAIVVERLLLEGGMKLHFNHGGLDSAQRQHRLELRNGHVGHADALDQAHVHQTLHLPPGGHEAIDREGFGIRVAAVAVAARRMVIREGPVEEVDVQAVQTQVAQRLCAGQKHVALAVHVVPDLGGDEHLVARHHALVEQLCKDRTDLRFISIDAGAINEAIAGANRAFNCGAHHIRSVVVGCERTDADGGDERAVRQAYLRNQIRINHRKQLLCVNWFYEAEHQNKRTAALNAQPFEHQRGQPRFANKSAFKL